MRKSLHQTWRGLSLIMIFLIAFSPMIIPAGAAAPVALADSPTLKTPISDKREPVEDPMAKMSESLRQLALGSKTVGSGALLRAAPQEPVVVQIFVRRLNDRIIERMKTYFVDGKLHGFEGYDRQAGGVQKNAVPVLSGLILPGNLLKVASLGEVEKMIDAMPQRNEYEVAEADDTAPKPTPKDLAELRANAEALRADSPDWEDARAFGDGRDKLQAPNDWFEMSAAGPTQAELAWDMGYRGEGVRLAVLDDGIDFAHPDLMGTQAIYNSTEKPEYNGWPYIMDPFSMRAWFYDQVYGTDFVASGHPGVMYVDTSYVPKLAICREVLSCFYYQPLDQDSIHRYYFPPSFTKSGQVHVGTHHDQSLRDYIWGEQVVVLVTDYYTAGVYDTVFVDLDADHYFGDEKPMRRADVSTPATLAATYNNPISYRDMNGDGLADLSGGALYFIADGVHHIPGMQWLFALDLIGIDPPGNGDLVAIHGPWDSGYSHGTQCASNVVGQGVTNALLPRFRDLPPYPGTANGAVYGAAPEAKLVAMNHAWSFSGNVTERDAYYLLSLGWDDVDQTGWHFWYGPGFDDTDGIQASSHSYGYSSTDNDGWDQLSYVAEDVMMGWAPYHQMLFSTGNGGAGYGTAAPPSPQWGIGVGASSEFGSTGWDSITDTNQINFNDMVWFSNAGPGMRNGTGADVLAGGAFAAGAEELNYYTAETWGVLDGNLSWVSWGGTSRSAPTALGVIALIYQAYKDAHGFFPDSQTAKAILMAGARDIKNDVFKQGAGAVNAYYGVSLASGYWGAYPGWDSYSWTPGDYRGNFYPGFAQVTTPDSYWEKDFTLVNDSESNITADLSTAYLQLIDSQEIQYDVTQAMVAAESAYGAGNRDNFYKAFNFFIPITGPSAEWQNVSIPLDADLMVVRQIFPYDAFDVYGNYTWDNRFYLGIYNWKDINGDGNVWEDKDGNGVVNFINAYTEWTIDGGNELAWDDPRTELDRWEFSRYGYNRTAGNTLELSVQDPLSRMHDGMFIGVRHLYTSAGLNSVTYPIPLTYRFEFYKKADVPWLSTDVTSLVIPAGDTAQFTGQVNVPADMPYGDYQAAIEVTLPTTVANSAMNGVAYHTTVIPVTLHVAAEFDGGTLTLGGQEAYQHDADTTYNNGAVRGYFDWSWREESGDWRAFYVDVQNELQITDVFLEEHFDSGIPGTWTVDTPSGYYGWQDSSICGYANYTGGSGDFADANSDCMTGDPFDSWLITPSLDFSTASSPMLLFNTDFWIWDTDEAMVRVSTDGGSTWSAPLLDWTSDRFGPHTETIDLSAYAGESDVKVAFYYTTNGDTYQGWWQVDDVLIGDMGYPIDPNGHLIIQDVWDGAAPHTDIDTVVLGRISPHPMSKYTVGAFNFSGYSAGYHGPYALGVLAKSEVARSGRSTWFFDTTSGGAEEWVMWAYKEGLHEILQHNVLSEGLQFETVFTKTMGVLTEDVHELYTETYFDQGILGDVNLESSLALPNGMVASGYLLGSDIEQWTNEPLDFTGTGTLEWVEYTALSSAASIYLETSSANIADLDLYLFYCNPGCVQVGSSAGVDANEHIFIANPPDGTYAIAIDNYSGPAGTFNLLKEVMLNIGGITAVVTPSGALTAGQPVNVHVTFDAPLQVGYNYGVLFVGPAEAPYLKEIPLTIFKWASMWIPWVAK